MSLKTSFICVIKLSGIVEVDETEMNISFSCNNKIHNLDSILPRIPYKFKT